MASSNDWENVANEARQIMADISEMEAQLQRFANFYNKNAFTPGDYLDGLADGDAVAESGVTKSQVASVVTFAGDMGDFLDSAAVAAADRRMTVESTRATR